ncbi:MAG: PKD-like domain-containing protein [Bacteroidota bacterium]
MNKFLTSLLLLFIISSSVFGQSVNVTITYSGAQSQGCCNVCGVDYWCMNNTGGCGTTNACENTSFSDPIPAGNIITSATVTYFGAGCYATSEATFINGVSVGSAPNNNQCICGACDAYPTPVTSFPCGIPGYAYGGINTLSCCPDAAFCPQRAVVTFTYTSNSGIMSFAPSAATATPSSLCGGSTTLSQVGGSLGIGASYNWYSGSCGGTFVGSGSSITVSPSSTTTYFVLAAGTCNTTGCASVTVTVSTPSTAPSSATASPNPTCGGATTLTEIGGSLGTGASYNWYSGSCNGTFVGSGASISVSPSSTTTYFVLASGTCNTTACASVTVTVNSSSSAPTSASASPATVCAGVSSTLSQSGGSLGAGAAYKWYSGSCGGTLVGTGSSITVNPSTTTTYFVRAEGSCNNTACASVTVTVNQVPFATASPSPQTICSGTATSIALNSFTPGTSFSWTVTQSGVTGATPNNGATIAQTLTATGTSAGTATYTVTPTAAGCVGNPITVIVTVDPIPVATATPTAQTICSGTASSIVLTSTVSGSTFSWTTVQTAVTGASNSSGLTIAQTLTATGPTSGSVVYTVTPSANSCSGAPITVTVTVDPKPVVTATPALKTICSGSNTSIALSSNVSGTSFNWTVSSTGVSGGLTGNGANITDVLTTTGAVAGTAVYTVTPTANNCAGDTIHVTITVNPMDDASFSYSASTYCQTGNDTSATVTGLPGGIFSSTAGLVFLNTSTGLIDLSASTLGTYTVTYTTNGICPNTSTASFTITSSPATGFSYTGSPYCQFGTNPSPTFVPGAFAGTFSATPAGLVFANANTGIVDLTASTPGTYTVKNIIVASGGCSADSATTTFVISTTPVATASPSPDTICSGTATGITLSSTLPGTTYTWTVAQTGIVGATPGSTASIAQTLTTTGTVPGTAIYTIIPTVGSCVGSAINDTITVNLIPVATATPPSQTFCSGVTTAISLTGSVAGSTFSWTASPAGVLGAAFGSGPSIAQTLTTTGSIAGTVTYMVTPMANGCSGNATSVTVTVNPPDDASFNYTSATYCQSGTNQTPSITGLQGGIFFSTPAGLSINATTGTINLAASALNAYTLSYLTNGICPDTSSIIMTIDNSNPLADFSYSNATYCQNGVNPSPIYPVGGSAGIYSSIPAGLVFVHVNTGQIDLAASTPGTYTVINNIPVSGTCASDSASTTVTITPSDDASFTYTSATYCISGTNQLPTISGVPGGLFSLFPAGLAIDTLTGEITLSSSLLGLYTVTYSTNGPCPNTSSITMTIDSVTPSAVFTFPNASYCQNGSDPSPVYIAGASAGTYSSTPSGLTFVHVNTGQIDLSSSAPGTYTVTNTIPASGNCFAASDTTTVTITAEDDASFVYSSATYCLTGPNPTPTVTGLAGGIFSATPAGLSINPTTGAINLTTSSVGSYALKYTTNGPCQNSSTITMTITTNVVFASFSYPNTSYCQNGVNPLPVFATNASAGIFSVTPIGLVFAHVNTGEIDLAASAPGTYIVTNTIPAGGGCAAVTATTTVIITPADDASFVYTSATYCISGNPQTPVITGMPGGTFSSSPSGLSINPTTGVITLTTSALGVYNVSYTTNGTCSNTSSITMTIIANSPFADFSYPASPFCQNDPNPFPTFGPGASAGIFSVSPGGIVFAHVNTGEIDLGQSAPGTYTVLNTIPASGTCGIVTATSTVIINGSDDASFVYSSATYCLTGTNQSPAITGLLGGVFSSVPPGMTINPATGEIDLNTSSVGAYTLTYTTSGTCPNSSSIIMTLTTNTVFANFSYPGSPFCQNAGNPYPTFAPGASAGIFSAPAGLEFVHVNTGQIDLAASVAGTYIVTNTIPAGGGCAAVTETYTVTINPPDNASFTYSSATYCTSGTPQAPTITGVPGGTFMSSPAGLSINPATGIITLSTSSIGAYTLSYMTNGTCPDTSSITMTITNTTPFANFSYQGSPFCQSGIDPYPTFGPGASAGTFTAIPAGLVFVHVNTGQIDLSASASGTYTVTNTIPISGSCGTVSATTTIIINSAPAPIATPVTQNMCTGGSTSIALTSSVSGTIFMWTVVQTGVTGGSPAGGATIAQTLTLTGTTSGTALYTVTSNANGCVGQPITVPITINLLPVANSTAVVITPANCGASNGSITGVVMVSGQAPFTYQWKDSLNVTVDNSINLDSAGAGNYTLTVTDSNGCSVSAGPFVVPATPPVVAGFTLTPITGETPLLVNFTNTSSVEAVNFLWEFGTGDSSVAVNPSYTYLPLGDFIVCLTADNGFGCSDSACASVNVYLNSVFIIPNVFTPNDDDVNDVFSVQTVGLKKMDAEIFNRWGEKEYEWHSTNGSWDGRTASGVEAPAGTYYFIISATGIDGKEYFEKGTFTLIRDK